MAVFILVCGLFWGYGIVDCAHLILPFWLWIFLALLFCVYSAIELGQFLWLSVIHVIASIFIRFEEKLFFLIVFHMIIIIWILKLFCVYARQVSMRNSARCQNSSCLREILGSCCFWNMTSLGTHRQTTIQIIKNLRSLAINHHRW